MAGPPSGMTGASQINYLDVFGVDIQERKQGTVPGRMVKGNRPIGGQESARSPQQITQAQYNSWSAPLPISALNAVEYGWLAAPPQVGGMSMGASPAEAMSTLAVDQLNKMPVSSSPTVVRAPQFQRSLYEQFNHYRTSWPLYLGWRSIRDDSNTNFESRVGAMRVKPSANPGGAGQNQPGGVRMNPPLSHDMMSAAWRVPRFSTEPYTIIPVGVT